MACTACNYILGCLCRGAVSSSILYVGIVISFQFNLLLAIPRQSHSLRIVGTPFHPQTYFYQINSSALPVLSSSICLPFSLVFSQVLLISPSISHHHLPSPNAMPVITTSYHPGMCVFAVPVYQSPPTHLSSPIATSYHLLSPRHVGLCCTCRSRKSSWG